MCVPYLSYSTYSVLGKVKNIAPVSIQLAEEKDLVRFFKYLLSRFHYLGLGRIVGDNLEYLILDQNKRPRPVFSLV